MFIDARTIPKNQVIETDVAIVGAGVAGISMAKEFMDADFNTCIIESGGFKPDKATQSLYFGENIGIPYYPLDTARARFFGGTSHFWEIKLPEKSLGVRLRPLDPIDFEERDWVPYSGWPFDKSHLDPYYIRAHKTLRIRPYDYDPEELDISITRPVLPFNRNRVNTTLFQFAAREIFFDDYREIIEHSDKIKTLLHANVTEIETGETGKEVTGLNIRCLNGNQFSIKSRIYILSMGGLEVPRLLLLSNRVQPQGIGNQHDFVGRFFMEHPHLWTGNFIPANTTVSNSLQIYELFKHFETSFMGKIAIAEESLREEKLLNWVTSIHPDYRLSYQHYLGYHKPAVMAFRDLKHSLLKKRRVPAEIGSMMKSILTGGSSIFKSAYRKLKNNFRNDYNRTDHVTVFWLNPMLEQAPNPDSRVLLGNECDALGQRRIQLDWRLTPLDTYTITRAQEILDEELQAAGLGKLLIHTKKDEIPPKIHGGWHHMGTTRMHVDPKLGVVDADCRVHNVSNLYIGGASVFPTSGYANPVLTTVALVIRLADHIKEIMKR